MTDPFAYPAPAPATAPPPAPAPAVNPYAPTTTANPYVAPAAPVAQPVPVAQPAPTPAFDGDPFSGPAAQQPRGPRLREMAGRLLLIAPIRLEQGVASRFKNPDGSTVKQDRMTADVIILDGGPVNYGGKPEAKIPIPHDKVAQVPHRSPAMFISGVGLISQCRDALAKRLAGQPGMVLGRLTVGDAKGDNEPPWLLAEPTDADKAVARAYLATVNPFD